MSSSSSSSARITIPTLFLVGMTMILPSF
jgi:hypothetical protein